MEGKSVFFKGVAIGRLPMLKDPAEEELSEFLFSKRRT